MVLPPRSCGLSPSSAGCEPVTDTLIPGGARGERISRGGAIRRIFFFFGRKGGGAVSDKDPNSTKAHGGVGGGRRVTAGM